MPYNLRSGIVNRSSRRRRSNQEPEIDEQLKSTQIQVNDIQDTENQILLRSMMVINVPKHEHAIIRFKLKGVPPKKQRVIVVNGNLNDNLDVDAQSIVMDRIIRFNYKKKCYYHEESKFDKKGNLLN